MPRKKTKENPCIKCEALCCKDLSIPIKKPRTKHEIDKYFWYLHFEGVHVYISHHHWYLMFESRCRFLGKDNMCTQYEKRCDICRDHTPDNCEINGSYFDHMISSPEALLNHLNKEKQRRKRKAAAKKKQASAKK